jgi:chromosome segregation ATPase
MRRQAVELDDAELEGIPQDKRVRIVQAQIEGGRAELADLYKKLEDQKVQSSELEYRARELHTELVEARKRLHVRQKGNDQLSDQLRDLRGEIAQHESKLRSLGGDPQSLIVRDADLDRLAAQLERESANVLKLQAALESRRNELASIDTQYREEAEERTFELGQLGQERKKLLDLINLELQKLAQLKQRNASAVRGVAAHTLDAQLTAVLESIGSGV